MQSTASGGSSSGYPMLSDLEPLVTKTTLAASIVAFLERIPWAAVTRQMLRQPEGTPLAAVRACHLVLAPLSTCAMLLTIGSAVGPLLMHQVRPSFLPGYHIPCPVPPEQAYEV